MATYIITETPNVDWDAFDWTTAIQYKHRYESSDDRPTAQDEFERRLAAGLPAVLWRWENNEPTEMERCNITLGAT